MEGQLVEKWCLGGETRHMQREEVTSQAEETASQGAGDAVIAKGVGEGLVEVSRQEKGPRVVAST